MLFSYTYLQKAIALCRKDATLEEISRYIGTRYAILLLNTFNTYFRFEENDDDQVLVTFLRLFQRSNDPDLSVSPALLTSLNKRKTCVFAPPKSCPHLQQLLNFLSNPKTHNFLIGEFFHSDVNLGSSCTTSFVNDVLHHFHPFPLCLTKPEWNAIRSLFKPHRRFSHSFIREKLRKQHNKKVTIEAGQIVLVDNLPPSHVSLARVLEVYSTGVRVISGFTPSLVPHFAVSSCNYDYESNIMKQNAIHSFEALHTVTHNNTNVPLSTTIPTHLLKEYERQLMLKQQLLSYGNAIETPHEYELLAHGLKLTNSSIDIAKSSLFGTSNSQEDPFLVEDPTRTGVLTKSEDQTHTIATVSLDESSKCSIQRATELISCNFETQYSDLDTTIMVKTTFFLAILLRLKNLTEDRLCDVSLHYLVERLSPLLKLLHPESEKNKYLFDEMMTLLQRLCSLLSLDSIKS
ncbi:hypothetical protein RCL1_004657 [Eukaryota sp. TZLM3-RCL]